MLLDTSGLLCLIHRAQSQHVALTTDRHFEQEGFRRTLDSTA